MKFAILSILLTLLAYSAYAAAPHKSVLITYPGDTPDHVLDEAKAAVKKAGGVITHEYKLIKGFAANAPEKALELVRSFGEKFNAVVEEDVDVWANGGGV